MRYAEIMDFLDQIGAFSRLDIAALALFLAIWFAIGWRIEHPSARRPSTSKLMARYRREWMNVFLTRDPRIFDSAILANLRQGTSFFASATMIAIGGGLALIGNPERLSGVARDLAISGAPPLVWELKLLLVVVMLTHAFLAFVWSHRLFGYAAMLMASVPNDPNDPQARPRAYKAGEINVTAARSFNRGLRSVYFALAGLVWLLGAIPLVIATLVTAAVLWRREFASNSRAILMQDETVTGE